MVAVMQTAQLDKDLPTPFGRVTTALIWVVLLALAWSLPVLDYVRTTQERQKVESGFYYTPKMPAEWYVQRSEP